jgi:hypothetical protein
MKVFSSLQSPEYLAGFVLFYLYAVPGFVRIGVALAIS